MKRSRGRGRRPQNNNPNRTFDSSGPEIKIRGSAAHVYEKYLQLARDANSAGDRVMAENYLQHAEHYYRVMAVTMAQQPQQYQGQPQQNPQVNGNGNGNVGGNGRGSQNGENFYSNGANGPSFSLNEGGDEGDDEGDEAGAE